MKVNLWDNAFAHVPYSVPGRVSRHIEWVRSYLTWNGITIVTDAYLREGRLFRELDSRITIGWLLEGRAYGRANYEAIPRVIQYLDLLLTHDQEILDKYPEKARFVPFGGCWIDDGLWGMREKTRDVSHIYSDKKFMEGHRLRHEIAAHFPQLDCYGLGTPRSLKSKFPALAPYRFSVVVENDRAQNYFTEKLLDCFAVGTIPIYWGCPNIGDFFDTAGIVTFDSLADLDRILDRSSSPDLVYQFSVGAAERNLVNARKYVLPEDYIYLNVLKEIE